MEVNSLSSITKRKNMDKRAKTELVEQEIDVPEIHIESPEELPVINIVLNPSDLQNSNTLIDNTPLFIKKLWKIVNDEKNEKIISWNETGDGFVIHDQLQFISHTLPRYFKHNQLSSFVRQLNLYDFHKIQHYDKDFQFGHPFFLKDLPQLLPLIKRKTQSVRQRVAPAAAPEATSQPHQSSEFQGLLSAIKDIKAKNDSITAEMSKLRQDNAALWGEMNSLRVKYSKQTKIINKLIHFLIAYMQKHHSSRKSGRTVSTSNTNKYLKTGPKIMELDYRYRNNPHEFWSDFDSQRERSDGSDQEAYTVVEPSETSAENGNQTQGSGESPNVHLSSVIEEILPGTSAFNQVGKASDQQSLPQFNYTNSHPSSSKPSNTALQRAGGSNDNVGYLIDNSRVEINTIKELLKNLTPEDMADFYKLVNENYKIQEDDLSMESENDLVSLSQLSPLRQEYGIHIADEDLGALNNAIIQQETQTSPSVLNEIVQEQDVKPPAEVVPDVGVADVVEPPTAAAAAQKQKVPSDDDANLDLIAEDFLNTDELLNNVSVDQYFNIY